MAKIKKIQLSPGKIISTYKVFTTLSIDQCTLSDVKEKINLSVIGHKHCNKIRKDGKIVIKPGIDDKTEKYLANAHHHVGCGYSIEVAWDITEDGNFVNFRVVGS